VAGVALVAAVAVTIALASGGSGSKTTDTGKTSTTPAATSVRIYSPVNAGGGLAASVSRRASGSCFVNSIVIVRPDAWRCFIGNNIYDPCFQVNQTEVLCPSSGPWTNNGTLISIKGGLSNPSSTKNQGTTGLPWAIQMASGAQCLPLSGASNLIAGQRLGYDCSGGIGLYGNVHRSGSTWMIYTGSPHSAQLTLQPIRIAWY
jgi:hypothetical protein